jgi:hypothetical protein
VKPILNMGTFALSLLATLVAGVYLMFSTISPEIGWDAAKWTAGLIGIGVAIAGVTWQIKHNYQDAWWEAYRAARQRIRDGEKQERCCGFVPPGYGPCTRERNHTGPCAHPIAQWPDESGTAP